MPPAIATLGLNTTTPSYLRRFTVKLSEYRAQWAFSPLNEVLAGMVGTSALIPEVIAFSYVSGVSPEISLYASFVISIAIALTGGRPGMISGAAGSIAFVVRRAGSSSRGPIYVRGYDAGRVHATMFRTAPPACRDALRLR